MSISRFQDMFAKSGCGLAVLIVCAAVMVGSVFYNQCMYSSRGDSADNANLHPAVIHVAGNPVTADVFEQEVQKGTSQSPEPPSPEMLGYFYNKVITDLQGEGAKVEALKENGIKTDDASLIAAADKQFADDLDKFKQQLISQKKLSARSSEADFVKAVKAELHKTPDELRTQRKTQVKDSLGDHDKRNQLILQLAQFMLDDAARTRHTATDAEVRASYDTDHFQRLQFFPVPGGKPSLDDRVKMAQADIKKGVPFDKVISTYSNGPVGPKVGLNQNTVDFKVSALDSMPGMKVLKGMKVGQVSDVVDGPGGKAIYKLLKVTSDLPKDYEKDPARYRKQYNDQAAATEVQAEIDRAKNAPGLVTYDSPAFKALNDVSLAGGGIMSMQPGGPQPDKLVKAEEEAKKAETGPEARIAALARYQANSALWNRSGPDRAKQLPDRIDTLNDTLHYFENFDLRMELVDDYLQAKKPEEAANQLLQAATNNTLYNDSGANHFAAIRDKLQQLEKDKKIDSAAAKQVRDAQLQWSRARAEYDAQQQELKKEQAADQAKMAKEREEMEAKAKADEAKKKAAQKSIPPKAPLPSKPGGPVGATGKSSPPPPSATPGTAPVKK